MSLSFKCDDCGVRFQPANGFACARCRRVLCRSHLATHWRFWRPRRLPTNTCSHCYPKVEAAVRAFRPSRIAVGVLLGVVVAPLSAQSPDGLAGVRSLRCTFTAAASAEWEQSGPRVTSNTSKMELVFDQIDPVSQTARMIGNAGATDVIVIARADALTILERTPAGTFQVTVIYDWETGTRGRYAAVHSRHTLMDKPLPSQAYGECRDLG